MNAAAAATPHVNIPPTVPLLQLQLAFHSSSSTSKQRHTPGKHSQPAQNTQRSHKHSSHSPHSHHQVPSSNTLSNRQSASTVPDQPTAIHKWALAGHHCTPLHRKIVWSEARRQRTRLSSTQHGTLSTHQQHRSITSRTKQARRPITKAVGILSPEPGRAAQG